MDGGLSLSWLLIFISFFFPILPRTEDRSSSSYSCISAETMVIGAIICKGELRPPGSQTSAGRVGVGEEGHVLSIPPQCPLQMLPCVISSAVLGWCCAVNCQKRS